MPRTDLEGLRVCFVAGTLGPGGAERQLFYMVQALAASGAQPHVLTPSRGEFWEARIRALGVPVDTIAGTSRMGRLASLVGAVRRIRPAVVQSQHFYMNLYAVCAARAAGAAEVGAIRSNARAECADVGRLGPLSLTAPRAIAANSRRAIENAAAMGATRDRLHLIPNVVDTQRFVPGRHPREDGTVRLLAIGRHGPEKRFDRFLRVLAAAQGGAQARVTGTIVTPSARDRDDLLRLAADAGVPQDALDLQHGVADTAEVYRRADVFVLTSDWEGTPNVVLEAMASGLPIVATPVGGVPELLTHGVTGYLCEPGADDDMAQAVVALCDSPLTREQMGRRGRAFVEGQHALARLPDILSEFYTMVTA